MQLHSEWKVILFRSWSVRFMALSGLCSSVAVSLPIAEPFLNVNPVSIAVIVGIMTFVASLAGIAARVVYQKDMH